MTVLMFTAMTVAGCDGSTGPVTAGSTSVAASTAEDGVASSDSPVPTPSFSLNNLTPGLDDYTDRDDGCAQAISAIGYLDETLRPLGQEPYQEFDDLVRSKLAAVGGTLELEADDWPDPAVARQAVTVSRLATRAGALISDDPAQMRARVDTLLRYRIEAARLVLLCRQARPDGARG